MSDWPYADCCDYCVKADGDPKKEMDACDRVTSRCQGGSCSDCKACGDFILGAGFTTAYNLARRRPTIRPQGRPQVLSYAQRRLF